MSKFLKDIKAKSRAEWEVAYIDFSRISRVLQIFRIVSILYKYVTHHDEQETEQIHQLSQNQRQNIDIIGSKLSQIILFQRRKVDCFLRYKTYELYLSWTLIEQAISNLSNINFKEHEYYDKRKNIKQAVQIIYQNINSVIKFTEVNKSIIEYLESQIDQYVKPFYKWEDTQYTFFSDRNQLQNFAIFVNNFYGQHFCSVYNHNQLDLLAINKVKQTKPKEFYLMGLFIGFALLLLLVMVLSFILDIFEPDSWSTSAQAFKYIFTMFRGIALFILYMWGLSWNIWGFTNCGVNYRLILKMGTHYSTYIQVMKRAGFFTMVLLIMVIFYLTGYQLTNIKQINYIPIEYTPFIVYFIFFTYIFFPTKDVFNPKGRQYFYTVLKNILFSPFIFMTFIISFSTDQFVSFVQPLKDLAYTICYYTSNFSIQEVKQCLAYNTIKGVLIGYIVALIPLMFRMIQCFNQARQSSGKFFGHIQMWNFFKYTTSMITSTLSFLNKFDSNMLTPYICSSVISTLYAYYWDLKYDWGLLQKGAKYRFLRNTLSYKNPTLYYVAMVSNLLLRCAWTLTISSFIVENIQSTLLVFITSLLEIFRRCMWNFFRIQKQHLGNCKDFRTTQSISSILESTPLKEALKIQSQDSDYELRLDVSNSLTLHHRSSTKKAIQTQKHTSNLIHNTTSEMVNNALQLFKRLVRKQQDVVSLNYFQNMKKVYDSIDKPDLILAKYNLKQS